MSLKYEPSSEQVKVPPAEINARGLAHTLKYLRRVLAAEQTHRLDLSQVMSPLDLSQVMSPLDLSQVVYAYPNPELPLQFNGLRRYIRVTLCPTDYSSPGCSRNGCDVRCAAVPRRARIEGA